MAQSIRDIMTKDVQTVSPETTVKDAASMMKSRNIGSLPVTEGKRVLGLVTDRDITIRCVAEGRDPGSTRCGDVMSKDVVTVREDADLKEAERLMHDRQIRRLPVVNAQDELAGYLAMAKIARSETLQEAGKVIKGVSQPSAPQPMESYGRRRRQKTG